jgi:hypothetical protein
MRIAPIDVTLENLRVEQTTCSLRLKFDDAEKYTGQHLDEGAIRAPATFAEAMVQGVRKGIKEAKAAMTRPSPDPDIAQEPDAQPPSAPVSAAGSRNTRPTGRGAR